MIPSAPVRRVPILGVGISAVNMQQAVAVIDGWIQSRAPNYVTVTPAHTLMDAYKDPELRSILNASGMTTPDGLAVVWLLRLWGCRCVSRVYGPDLMLEVSRVGVQRGYRHFLYGGEEGVSGQLADRLHARFPGIQIVGAYEPPFRDLTEAEDRAVIAGIEASQADIVWVGISSPKQERWMAAHVGRTCAPVLIGVGAAFDFLSGRKPQAPRWIQRAGLEWLFRFATEPRRLWPRYRQYPRFMLLVLREMLAPGTAGSQKGIRE